MAQLTVTIKLAETWPSPKELAARNSVTDALDAAKIGKCIGAGGGMGEMDFAYDVTDESFARNEVTTAMQTLMPGSQFQVRCTY